MHVTNCVKNIWTVMLSFYNVLYFVSMYLLNAEKYCVQHRHYAQLLTNAK